MSYTGTGQFAVAGSPNPVPPEIADAPFPVLARWWLRECYRRARAAVPEDVGLNPEVWQYLPWGPFLVCLRMPPDRFWDKSSLLAIPDTEQKPQDIGWVCVVGFSVCEQYSQWVARPPYDYPLDAVGEIVTWPRWTGRQLQFSAQNSGYRDSGYIYVGAGEVHFTRVLDFDPTDPNPTQEEQHGS